MERILKNDKLNMVLQNAIEKTNSIAVYLFGSYADNTQNDESDLDLAFYLDKKINRNVFFKSYYKDFYRFDKPEIDLIILDGNDPIIKKQVIEKGKVIYCNDEHKRKVFEMNVISEYCNFKFERREISQFMNIKI